MIKHIYTTAGIALMLISVVARAQTTAFEKVVQEALTSNPAILSKRSLAAAARADLEGASWQRYPTPSVEVNTDNNGVRTSMLRVQQPIWAGGRIDAGIDAATSRQQAAELAIEESRQEVVFKIIAAYVEAVRRQAHQETLARGLQQHEELLALIARRVEREASPRVDQELAQSRLYEVNNELSSVKQALSNALGQLTQLAGTPVSNVEAVQDDRQFALQGRESMLEQTLARSPALRRLSFEESAAQADVEAKRAGYKPQVSLRFENAHSSAPLNGVPAYSTSRILFVLEAQTGAGLSAFAGIDAAVARQEAARQQREAAARELRERFTIDWNELQFARDRLADAQRASRSAREVYESYTRQYTTGRKGWFEVLNTVRESTQSEIAALEASSQATGAWLRLRLVTGNLKGLYE